MKTPFKNITAKIAFVLENYAFVMLAAFLASLSVTLLVDNRELSEESANIFTRFSIVSILGISLLFALNILSERIGKKILLNIGGLFFLAAYFQFLLPHENRLFREFHMISIALSFLLSHLLVSFIAFLGKEQEISFWQFNKNLFVNIILTGIFAQFLVGGVMLALAAIDHLFEWHLDPITYPRTLMLLSIFGSCFIFLLFSEKGLKSLEKEDPYPTVLKFFVQFILIPLLILYVIILYFYGGKILWLWKLPQGWVSILVLAYSVVGILALLLVFPLRELQAKSWVKWFSKIFYFALLPLLVLLYVALFKRVLAYGFTENRYYVLLLAIWLTQLVFYFIFWKKSSIKWIPISLFILGLFSLILPYLNAFETSKRSQKNSLNNLLQEHHLLENGTINFNKKVQDSVATEIAEKFDFLNKRKEQEFLLKLLPPQNKAKFSKIVKEEKYSIVFEIKNEFKNTVSSTPKNDNPEEAFQRVFSEKSLYENKGYDYVLWIDNITTEKIESFDQHVFTYKISQNLPEGSMAKIELQSPQKIIKTYDLMPFLKEKVKLGSAKNKNQPLQEISTEFDLHDYHFKVYFSSINQDKNEKKIAITVGDLLIFVKKKQP